MSQPQLLKQDFSAPFTKNVTPPAVLYFLLFWFCLNIIQVSFTELTSDEGYYWFYAQHLQWGYYDHPPMLALMIKAGSYLFPGALGVRFFNVVFSTASLYLFFRLLPATIVKGNIIFLVVLSAPLVHYLTFIVFPDGPLLFFSLCFLFVYKRFLAHQNFSTSLLLGVCVALMAWSKYHGALAGLFTVLANPRLLRQKFFYLSVGVAFIVFAPHLWWQYQHNFPTLRYHLSGRTGSYSFTHVGEYLSQQLVAIGPGLIFIPFVTKARDVFERTLKFIIIGTFIFFLISSLKTFVHFHWTSIAVFPLLYFAANYYQQEHNKWFRSLIIPFVILFFIVRLLLMIPVVPNMHAGEDYYHGRKAWAANLSAIAGSRPVFIPNNLREASLYSFYSGKMGATLYTRPEKKSQYELWGYEDSLQGKEVVLITKERHAGSRVLNNSMKEKLYYSIIPSFQSYYYGTAIDVHIISNVDSVCVLELNMTNNRNTSLHFDSSSANRPQLFYWIEKNKEPVSEGILQPLTATDNLLPGQSLKKKSRIRINNLTPGAYQVLFGIRSGVLPDAVLSEYNDLRL